jgi:hypothetical protein
MSVGILVENELHSISESRYRDYYFIVPNFSPFYIDDFSATITHNGETKNLLEDIDFSFSLQYVTGTRVKGKAMYGAITIHTIHSDGIISLNYRKIEHKDQIPDRNYILTTLANKAYNPKTTVWDSLTNVPNAFPPSPHYQDYDDFFGQEELVSALNSIKNAIYDSSSIAINDLNSFLNAVNEGTVDLVTTSSLDNYIKRTGGTMLGSLTLAGDPANPMQAVTRQYVDKISDSLEALNNSLATYARLNYVNSQDNLRVSKTGDTMTGHLKIPLVPVEQNDAVSKAYLDSINNMFQQNISNMQTILNMLTSDPVTKKYVDDKIDKLLSHIATK